MENVHLEKVVFNKLPSSQSHVDHYWLSSPLGLLSPAYVEENQLLRKYMAARVISWNQVIAAFTVLPRKYFPDKRKWFNLLIVCHFNTWKVQLSPNFAGIIFSFPSKDDFIISTVSIQPFTLECIEAATEKYKTLIGEGGFGSVYRGILNDGQEVAVKVRSATSTQGTREFENEVHTPC